jgi:acyl-[acyl-carrier-protein]-phospholipid O-acyltransferase/long-chain-fatty-acid--[acyl-carrier-protein] ligase
MFKSLMMRRKFAPLFFCQFFAAFGDNFLKTALSFVVLAQIAGANSGALITLAGAVFIAPFFFLSGLGGELADRYDKAWVAQRIKFVEIGAAAQAPRGDRRARGAGTYRCHMR